MGKDSIIGREIKWWGLYRPVYCIDSYSWTGREREKGWEGNGREGRGRREGRGTRERMGREGNERKDEKGRE